MMGDEQAYPGIQLDVDNAGRNRSSSGQLISSFSGAVGQFFGYSSARKRAYTGEDPEEHAAREAAAGRTADYIIIYPVSPEAEDTEAAGDPSDPSEVDIKVAEDGEGGQKKMAAEKKAERAAEKIRIRNQALEKLKQVNLVLREQNTQVRWQAALRSP